MKTGPTVSIIIPTMNTPALTGKCLQFVMRHTRLPYEIIVVNNSRGRSIRRLLHAFRNIRLIQNPNNVGFAKAANQGARAACGKYLCFLNSDTLVPPQWLERLLRAARPRQVGAVGPWAQSQSDSEIQWEPRYLLANSYAAALADQAAQKWYRDQNEETSHLWGFCFLTAKKVFEKVGFFDERFFFGCEDDDFCLRLRLAGYRLFKVKSVFVHHAGSGSIGRQKRRRWVQKARALLFKKWSPAFGARCTGTVAFIRASKRLVLDQKKRASRSGV